MQIIQNAGPGTQGTVTGRLIDGGLIRQLLLTYLRWPTANREFVLTISAISVGRSGWFPHGHEFTGHVLGYVGTENANRARVRRDLLNYERATFETGRRLFEFRRGGGETKAVTEYGTNFLNLAADYIQEKANSQREPIPAIARVERLIPEALALIPQLARPRKKRSKSVIQSREQKCSMSIDAPRALNNLSAFPVCDAGGVGEKKEGNKQEDLHTHTGAAANGVSRIVTYHWLGFDIDHFVLAAAALVKKRLWVIPLHSLEEGGCSCKHGRGCLDAGRHPRIKYRHQGVATSLKTVLNYWTRKNWRGSNIGVLTGKEVRRGWSLIVLDIDRRNRGDVSLALLLDELGITLPETYTVETADGEHIYLLVPTDRLTKAQQIIKGVDVKGVGALVLGAGSVHRSGIIYAARNADAPIARMPAELIDLIFEPLPNRVVEEGDRHKFLLRCAGAMAGAGHSREQILITLRTERAALCVPGEKRALSDSELENIAAYVERQERDQRITQRGSAA